MDGLEPTIDKDELAKAIQELKTLEKEREDIVLGFIKEKEITEKIHSEELQELRKQYDEEIEAVREEFMNEKEKVLRETQSLQVEHNTRETEKGKENEKQFVNKSEHELKKTEESFKIEKRKLREEYESLITQKTNEIEELYRENCILRSKSDPESFEDASKEAEIYKNKLKGEMAALKENYTDQIQKLKTDFDFERSELERNHVREKAEFVKNMNVKFDEQQENNEIEKNKHQRKFHNELKAKITIVEQLWEDRCTEERNRMNTRFENEFSQLKTNFSEDLEEKLAEREGTIDNLEIEKDQLLNAIHVERFELAKFYNRELSLLNRSDSTKEDIEVALIDEVAKLRDEQQKVIRNMEKRHKRKLNDLKEKQKPLEEILEQHKNDIDGLKSHYEKEREEFEATLRNEQLTLLKSFEFEKNDIERYYKQVIDDRENEFKEKIENIQKKHEKETERMGKLEKENVKLKEKLSQMNDKNDELTDKLQEIESHNSRLKEELERENRGKREQPDGLKGLESSSDLQKTTEQLSKSNIQLANQLAHEQTKCEELLKRTLELEKLHQEALSAAEEDDIKENVADEVASTPTVGDTKLQISNGTSEFNNFVGDEHTPVGEEERRISPSEGTRVMEKEKERKDQKRGNELTGSKLREATSKQKEHELQDNLQQYLLELKSIQGSMDSKEMELRQMKEEYEQENNRLKQSMQDLKQAIKHALDGDNAEEENMDTLKSRHKEVKDLINQGRKDDTTERHQAGQNTAVDKDPSKNDFRAEVDALDELTEEDFDHNESAKQDKENVNEKLKAIKAKILRSHDLELLECQQKHEQEKNIYLKELTDEKEAEIDISKKVWEAVCEKLGIEGNKSKEKLQELLQKEDPVKNENSKYQSEEKDHSEDTEEHMDKDEVEKLKHEKEGLEQSLVELEKHFNKEKKKLLKKMETQHKEFVLSPEAEVIEALTKEKTLLEEASNIERFNLGRIYYMEMQDELEELMAEKMDDLEKEKTQVILKFNEDIADLLKIIADKDQNEVDILKDKNAMARKMLSLQKKTEDDNKLDESEVDELKSEAEKLEAIIPLKKEIAELQRKRQEEHGTNAENLGKAVDVIKDLLAEKSKEKQEEKRRNSFGSTWSNYGSTLGAEEKLSGTTSNISEHGGITPSESRISSRPGKSKKSREPTPLETNEQTLSPSRCTSLRSSRNDVSSQGRQQETKAEKANQADTTNVNAESGNQTSSPRPNECQDEINSKEDLLKALESLIDNAFADDKTYESDNSSGAISDFDSEPGSPISEREDGVSDSGAESIDNECLSIKKSELEQALHMERIGLGRVYYNEYKDCLQEAFQKLAKAKGKTEALENLLSEGAKELVNRASFSNMSASFIEAETQTSDDEVVDELSTMKNKDARSDIKEDAKQESMKDSSKNKKDPKQKPQATTVENDTTKENNQESLTEPNEENKDRDDDNLGVKGDQEPTDKASTVEESSPTSDSNKTKDTQNAEPQTEDHAENKEEPHVDTPPTDQSKIEQEPYSKVPDEYKEGEGVPPDQTKIEQEPKTKLPDEDKAGEGVHEQRPKEPVKEDIVEECLRTIERMPSLGSAMPDNDDHFQEDESKDEEAENVTPSEKDIAVTKALEDSPSEIDETSKPQDETENKGEHNEPQKKDGKKTESVSEKTQPEDEPKDEDVKTTKSPKNGSNHMPQNADDSANKANDASIKEILDDETKDLAKEYKKLKDHYNILKALVGKGFVDKIPELNDQRENEQNSDDIDENDLKELQEEEKSIAEEIKALDKQIDALKNMSDSNVREEEKKLNDQELDVLKQLEKINDALKIEEDKDLIEHLKNEKAEIEKKLEELERDLEDKRAQIESEEQNFFDLMKKKLDLEGEVAKKAQKLDKHHKNLAQLKQDDETQDIEKEIENLKKHEEVLRDIIDSHLPHPSSANEETEAKDSLSDKDDQASTEIATDSLIPEDKGKVTGINDKDSEAIKPLQAEALGPKVEEIAKQVKDNDRGSTKAAKKLKQAQRDRDRYIRMAEDQANRLKPFLKKQQRLIDALGMTKDDEEDIKPSINKNDPLPSGEKETQMTTGEEQGSESSAFKDEDTKDEKNGFGKRAVKSSNKTTNADPDKLKNSTDVVEKKLNDKDNDEQLPNLKNKDRKDVEMHLDGDGNASSNQVANFDPETLRNNSNTIKNKLNEVEDQIALLSDKVKEAKYDPITESLVNHIQALKDEVEEANAKMSATQATLGSMETGNEEEISNLLEAKAEQGSELSDMLAVLPVGFDTLSEDIQKVIELACQKNDLEQIIAKLGQDIDKEETCFQEAVQYQREGALDESYSQFGEAVNIKENLMKELSALSMEIADTLDQEEKPGLLDDKMQKKKELEEVVEKLQDEIEHEPARAANHLSELIKTKHEKEDDLANAVEQLPPVKHLDLSDVPEPILSVISLQKDDMNDFETYPLEIKELEKDIQENASEVSSLYHQQKNPESEEDNLVQLIKKHKSLHEESPMKDEDSLSSCSNIPPASVIAEMRKITEDLQETESKLNAIKDKCNDDEIAQMQELEALINEKHDLDREKELLENLCDLLDKKNKLEKELEENKTKQGLMGVNKIIQEKEKEIKRLEDNVEDIEASLENLMNEMNNNVADETGIEKTIKETLAEIHRQVGEAEKEKEKRDKTQQKAESRLNEAVSNLEDELEESREELDFVENELENLQGDPEKEGALSSELIDLTALLNTKKSLEDYLLEIDTKLDNSDESKKEPLSQNEIDTLRAKKREAENELAEIQEEKSKFEVELQDDEIQETFDALCEEKKQLEEQKNVLMGKIHGANIFSRMADEIQDEKPGDEDKSYYTHALNEMISGPKTLIQLAEENERLKDIACNQRRLMEEMNESLEASLGDKLANALTTPSTDIDEKDIHKPIIDRLANQETVEEIVNDLSNENKELRDMNDELSNDLESLKEKIGDKLTKSLINPNEETNKAALGPLYDFIAEDGTIQELLEEQHNGMGRIEDVLGKNLANVLISPDEERSVDDDFSDLPKAAIIMKDKDEDLETVLAAYEDKLELLGRENDALKSMLGNDLAQALLDLGQSTNRELWPVPAESNIQKVDKRSKAEKDATKDKDHASGPDDQKSTKEKTDEPSTQEVPTSQDIKMDISKSDKGNAPKRPMRKFEKNKQNELQSSTAMDKAQDQDADSNMQQSKNESKENMDNGIASENDRADKAQQLSAQNTQDPHKMSKKEGEIHSAKASEDEDKHEELPKDGQKLLSGETDITPSTVRTTSVTPESEAIALCGIEAPIHMAKESKTLGEVIKGYENDLDTLKSRLGPRLFDSIIATGRPQVAAKDPASNNISDEDRHVQKGKEPERVVGSDKDVHDEEKPHESIRDSDDTRSESKERDSDDVVQPLNEDVTNQRIKSRAPRRRPLVNSPTEIVTNKDARKPSKDGPSSELDKLSSGAYEDEETPKLPKEMYPTPSNMEGKDVLFVLPQQKMIDENKTLEDVIEDFAEELQTIKSQIGPELYKCLLATGRQGKDGNHKEDPKRKTMGTKDSNATLDIYDKPLDDKKHKGKASNKATDRDFVTDRSEEDTGLADSQTPSRSNLTDDGTKRLDETGSRDIAPGKDLQKSRTKSKETKDNGIASENNRNDKAQLSSAKRTQDPEGISKKYGEVYSGKVGEGEDKHEELPKDEQKLLSGETDITPSSGRTTSITPESEAIASCGIEAPIHMAKESKTLGEVIKGYENDLDTLKSRLGPRLFDSILATARPQVTEKDPASICVSDEDRHVQKGKEPERVEGSNEKVQEEEKPHKSIPDSDDMRSELKEKYSDDVVQPLNEDVTNERIKPRATRKRPLVNSLLTEIASNEDPRKPSRDSASSDLDKLIARTHEDEETSKLPKEMYTTPSNMEGKDVFYELPQQKMIDENKTLEDVMHDYAEELQTIKSQIGPELYKCLLATGRQGEDGNQKDDPKRKPMGTKDSKATPDIYDKPSDDIKHQEKASDKPTDRDFLIDSNEEDTGHADGQTPSKINSTDDETKRLDETGSRDIAPGKDLEARRARSRKDNKDSILAGKPDAREPGEVYLDNLTKYGDMQVRMGDNDGTESIESGEIIDLEVSMESSPQYDGDMLAPLQMKEQNQTLEEVLKSYENDLQTLKDKLGPELYESILDASQQKEKFEQPEVSSQKGNDGYTPEEEETSFSDEKQPQKKACKKPASGKTAAADDIETDVELEKAAQQAAENSDIEPSRPVLDDDNSEVNVYDSGGNKDERNDENIQPSKRRDEVGEKGHLKASRLLREPDTTVQDIIKEYENALDVLNSKLGPNLLKAILDSEKKKSASRNEADRSLNDNSEEGSDDPENTNELLTEVTPKDEEARPYLHYQNDDQEESEKNIHHVDTQPDTHKEAKPISKEPGTANEFDRETFTKGITDERLKKKKTEDMDEPVTLSDNAIQQLNKGRTLEDFIKELEQESDKLKAKLGPNLTVFLLEDEDSKEDLAEREKHEEASDYQQEDNMDILSGSVSKGDYPDLSKVSKQRESNDAGKQDENDDLPLNDKQRDEMKMGKKKYHINAQQDEQSDKSTTADVGESKQYMTYMPTVTSSDINIGKRDEKGSLSNDAKELLKKDMTLEDIIDKLQQDSNELKTKLGPSLTKLLLEDGEDIKANVIENDKETSLDHQDDEQQARSTEEIDEQKGSLKAIASKASLPVNAEESKKIDSKENFEKNLKSLPGDHEQQIPAIQQGDGTTDEYFKQTENEGEQEEICDTESPAQPSDKQQLNDGTPVKRILAAEIMKDQNAALEDVIQGYENDLSVLKSALGPNLVDLILNKNKGDDEIKHEDKQMGVLGDKQEQDQSDPKSAVQGEVSIGRKKDRQAGNDKENENYNIDAQQETQGDKSKTADAADSKAYKPTIASSEKGIGKRDEKGSLSNDAKELLEKDMTLEDIIDKLQQDSNELKTKLGPSLTKLLLEDGKDIKANVIENDKETSLDHQDDEQQASSTEEIDEQKGSHKAIASKASLPVNAEESKKIDSKENFEKNLKSLPGDHEQQIPAIQQGDGTTDEYFKQTENEGEQEEICDTESPAQPSDKQQLNDGTPVKRILAAEIMKDQNAALEDVIQGYENDLSVLKSALGPNLVDLILNKNKGDDEIKHEDKQMGVLGDKQEQDQSDPKSAVQGEVSIGRKKDRQAGNDKENENYNIDAQQETQGDKSKTADAADSKAYKPTIASSEKGIGKRDEKGSLSNDAKELLEKDMTLEDIIDKLQQDSNELKTKLGPSLTKLLLEDGEDIKANVRENGKETSLDHQDDEQQASSTEEIDEQKSPVKATASKTSLPVTAEESKKIDSKENLEKTLESLPGENKHQLGKLQAIQRGDGTADDLKQTVNEGGQEEICDTESPVQPSDKQHANDDTPVKRILAAAIMKDQNAALEDVIQDYENDLSVLKSALGPNLVDLILNKNKGNKEIKHEGKKMRNLADKEEHDDQSDPKSAEQGDVKMDTITDRQATNDPGKVLDKKMHEVEQKLEDSDEKTKEKDKILNAEMILKDQILDGDRFSENETILDDKDLPMKEEMKRDLTQKASDSLQDILLPLLSEDNGRTIEDVMQDLFEDLNKLNDRLGPNLSESLLRMKRDQQKALTDSKQKTETTSSKEGSALDSEDRNRLGENKSIENENENRLESDKETTKSKKTDDTIGFHDESPELADENDDAQDTKYGLDRAGTASGSKQNDAERSTDMVGELDALSRMSEKDQTLEEIIKKYEDTIDRYETALGPHLSTAILSNPPKSEIPSEGEQEQEKAQSNNGKGEQEDKDIAENEALAAKKAISEVDAEQEKSQKRKESKPGQISDNLDTSKQDQEQVNKDFSEKEMLASKKDNSEESIPKSKSDNRKYMLLGEDMPLETGNEQLKEPVKLIHQGKTLEDMLVDYEKDLEILKNIQGDDGAPISIDDVTAAYKKQIQDLENTNNEMHNDLDTLEAKLGPTLFKKLTDSEESNDVEERPAKNDTDSEALKSKLELTLDEQLKESDKLANDASDDVEETPAKSDTDAHTKHSLNREAGKSERSEKEQANIKPQTEDADDQSNQKHKILEEPMKVIDQGKTVEDMLIDYEKEREVLNSIQSDDGAPISIGDITDAYKKKIDKLEDDTAAMRKDLDTLENKLGPILYKELKGFEGTEHERHDAVDDAEETPAKNDTDFEAKLEATLDEKLKESDELAHGVCDDVEETPAKSDTEMHAKHPKDRKPSIPERSMREHINQKPLTEGTDDKANLKHKILEEPMKVINKGKTVEDMLIDYGKDREVLNSIQSDDGAPISIDDITEAYKKKIEQLQDDNAEMRNDLDILDTKLGTRLSNQLRGRPIHTTKKEQMGGGEFKDLTQGTEQMNGAIAATDDYAGKSTKKSEDLPNETKAIMGKAAAITNQVIDQSTGDKDAAQDSTRANIDKQRKETESSDSRDQLSDDNQIEESQNIESESMESCLLEAPIIMEQYNQTLEEVIDDYETQLKEMLANQEALKAELDTLEQGLGPKLYKELCELSNDDENDIEKGTKEEQEKENKSKDESKSDGQLDENDDNPKKGHSKSDFEAINKMTEEEKPLASVLEDYQDKCALFERENESLKKALSSVSGDVDVGGMISDYENKIQMLENENKEAEKEYEEKHNELQNEIKDLRDILEKLAQTLRQDFLDDLMKQQDTANSIEALQKMEKEKKTLAEVVEEYEDDMKRLEREKAVLEQLTGQSEDGASMLDTINDYEDSIKSLKDVNKMLNQRIDALSRKLGPTLANQLTDLCEKTDEGSEKVKTKEWLPSVKKMKDNNATLEKVLQQYEDQELGHHNDEDEDTQEETLENLKKKIGESLINDLNDLDNRSIEELQNEDKRPVALCIMKKRNNNLSDVIKLYEDYLLQYGVLDTLQGESLASELEDALEGISIDIHNEPLVSEVAYREPPSSEYGTLVEDDFIITGAVPNENGVNDSSIEKEKQLADLQKQLEEEKELKEKYQKDVEDLLNDIVKLKLKNAGDDEDKDELERQIKEEYEIKQENETLKNELSKAKDKNKELEKDGEDLKSEMKNMEKEIQRLENALEEMQKGLKRNLKDDDDNDMAKKLEELQEKNEELEKEIEDLKCQLKEKEENFQTEKNNLMEHKDQEKKDTMKDLLEAKAEVELQLQEQLSSYHELEERLKETEEGSDKDEDEKLKQLKMRNESLKEQLDHSEEAMKQALEKYQEQIKQLEVENAKTEEEKKHEIELLNNKLELEKNAHGKLKEEYDEMLKKKKQQMHEDFEDDLEREKRKTKKDLEEQMDDLERLRRKHEQELNDLNNKSKKEKNDLNNLFEEEKQKLQKNFDEKMSDKEEEYERELEKLREELEDKLISEKAELSVQFNQEKAALQAEIEKNIYGDEIQKNIDLESDFQGTLSKVLEEHASEIEDIDREMKQADKELQEQKHELYKELEKEREKDKRDQDKLRQEMESNIESMLKEIIKLKHQRKEMRHHHRIEKQNMEELFENERNEIQASIERSKDELLAKLKEEHEKKVEHEREKYEEIIKELQEALDKAEAKRKEFEEKLRNEERKAEESRLNNETEERPVELQKEIKVIKRSFEVEYEKKLSVEKQRFEETLQGLRREVGSLQEKRKIIQERVYNQEGSYSAEKHVIEKSIANYKLEVLAKLEGEMGQRLNRERKPLEEEIKELQTENEELKRERWEMKIQYRREKTIIEEKYEKEKETMEQSFNKEREEMRKRLEATLQKQEKVNRIGGTSLNGEPLSSPRIDNTVRMLQQENLSLVTQNARLEADVGKLNDKLESIEGNFKEMVQYEKTKVERVKQIQQEIPKKVMFKELHDRPVPDYTPPSTSSTQDDGVFETLQEKDQQIQQLLQAKRYYETVLGELCDEAGLFELDRNEVV